MKKRYIIAIFALVIAMLSALPALAEKTYLNDFAGLLTYEECEAVEAKLKEISKKHKMDIVVLTIDSLGYNDEVDVADDYYDDNGYAKDGVLLLFSYEDDIRYLSTSGFCIDAFENNLSDITYAISDYMADENYADAFISFAEKCDEIIQNKKSMDHVITIVISVVVGLVVAFIVGSTLKGQLKSVTFKSRAENYMKTAV